MKRDARQLKDLDGVGKAALKDFELLGVKSVSDLAKKDPFQLYDQLIRISGPQDVCVLDVLRCAVAQSKNPKLPKEKRNWWYWSKVRKEDKES
jgi:nucleotidyltransferase/DNA polymerase involved in DNA repair